MHYLIPGNLKC